MSSVSSVSSVAKFSVFYLSVRESPCRPWRKYSKLYGIAPNPAYEEGKMTNAMPKDQAHLLIDQLPDNATWEDLIDEIRVREAIESGLRDSEAGALRRIE